MKKIYLSSEQRFDFVNNAFAFLALFFFVADAVPLICRFDTTQLWFTQFSWETFKADAQGLQISDLGIAKGYNPTMVASVIVMSLLIGVIAVFRVKTNNPREVLNFEMLSTLVEGGAFGIILMLFESRFPGAIAQFGALYFIIGAALLLFIVAALLKLRFKINFVFLLLISIAATFWVILISCGVQTIRLSVFPTLYLTMLMMLKSLEIIQMLDNWQVVENVQGFEELELEDKIYDEETRQEVQKTEEEAHRELNYASFLRVYGLILLSVMTVLI